MRHILMVSLVFLFSLTVLFLPKPAYAAFSAACEYEVTPEVMTQNASGAVVKIALDKNGPNAICGYNGVTDNCYEIYMCNSYANPIGGQYCETNSNFQSENLVIQLDTNGHPYIQSTTPNLSFPRRFWLESIRNGSRNNNVCNYGEGYQPQVKLLSGTCSAGWVTVKNATNPAATQITPKDKISIVYNPDKTSGFPGGGIFAAGYGVPNGVDFTSYTDLGDLLTRLLDPQGRLDASFGNTFSIGPLQPGTYEFVIADNNLGGKETYCEERFTVCAVGDETCTIDQGTDKGSEEQNRQKIAPFSFCEQVPGDATDPTSQRAACERCNPDGSGSQQKLYTSFGCIPIDNKGFANSVIQLMLGIAGMVALLSILTASFLFTTSQGDQGRVKTARELMTAAVSGLLFIIFSIIILNFIGVEILRIPGLG